MNSIRSLGLNLAIPGPLTEPRQGGDQRLALWQALRLGADKVGFRQGPPGKKGARIHHGQLSLSLRIDITASRARVEGQNQHTAPHLAAPGTIAYGNVVDTLKPTTTLPALSTPACQIFL